MKLAENAQFYLTKRENLVKMILHHYYAHGKLYNLERSLSFLWISQVVSFYHF